jgi:hypothetical protein
MGNIREEEKKLLLETIEYYTTDVRRRCIEMKDGKVIKCAYSPLTINNKFSDGCAIGRILPNDLKQLLDDECDSASVFANDVWKLIPNDIKEKYRLSFLCELQSFHDDSNLIWWNNLGLTEQGKIKSERLMAGIYSENF